ncbi:DUF3368 domain-containing protein [Opitutaceae bacterium TAV4]|nr:DUF3368 domain-containing protein [Opitutaceae bacterium TAV4]RRJ97239.1 DUF3368 domain-containing protein [Opitutaceae bacterium TAV4]RRK01203.1 DUF3368 domain-containing protein [Opitutaceae bacterium TAV3]
MFRTSLKSLLGILLKARKQNLPPQIRPCIDKMIQNGISLAPRLVDEALRLAGGK